MQFPMTKVLDQIKTLCKDKGISRGSHYQNFTSWTVALEFITGECIVVTTLYSQALSWTVAQKPHFNFFQVKLKKCCGLCDCISQENDFALYAAVEDQLS